MTKCMKLQNGRLFDPGHHMHGQIVDILINEGRIKKIGMSVNDDAPTLNANGLWVAPGFIDVHVHCYQDKTAIGIWPDQIGAKYGVTTVIDAGTTGANTFKDFVENVVKHSDTRVLALLNVASDGLRTLSELEDPESINEKRVIETVEKYRDLIVGLKVRASSSVLKGRGIEPIAQARSLADQVNLPLVVHIGNGPPAVEEVLANVDKGDVITHSYHNKPNGLFLADGNPKHETNDARERGVQFDVGHGTSSFSFAVAESAIKNGFKPDLIGSDLYDKNRETPVRSLIRVMNKLLTAGLTLEEVISAVTRNAATGFGLNDRGRIEEGLIGDLTLFTIETGEFEWLDSVGERRKNNQRIWPRYTVVGGKVHETYNGGI